MKHPMTTVLLHVRHWVPRWYEVIPMMKLVLIRHGESEWNKLNLFTGWMDVDLSDKGREEAKNAGQTLKAEGYDFDVCYTSYLKRAIHTLNIALDEMDRAWLPVVKSWKLNERHYGALQGLNKSETADLLTLSRPSSLMKMTEVPQSSLCSVMLIALFFPRTRALRQRSRE